MPRHKTLEDVQRVIAKSKPAAVVDLFISDYLLGVALDPVYAAEGEYEKLKDQPDLDPVTAEYDEQGNLVVEGVDYNSLRDLRIAELEKEYPHLVETVPDECRPIPDIDVQSFRDSIVGDFRRSVYPDIGDQLDAIWKQLNYDRMNGRALIQEADNVLGEVLAVKAKFRKADRPA